MSVTSDDPSALGTRGRLSVLRHRDFTLLYVGQGVSLLGDRLVMVAMPFAVLALPHAGPGDIGIVLGARILAFGVFVLFGGVLSDRVARQRTMLGSDAVRAVAQAASAALLLSGHASVQRLALLQLLYGGAEAFFRPAALGLVPQVVDPGEEQPANALLALSNNLAMVVGPVSAGVLVAWLGPGATLAVDAGTFVLSGLTLLALRPRAMTPAPRVGVRAELADGWREVHTRSWVWSVLLGFVAYHALVLPAIFVLGPRVAEQIRDGASSWGWISSGFGAGAVVGSLVALRWRPRRPGLVIGLALCVASAQGAICAAPFPTAVVALLEAVTGVAVSLCFTLWETALQQHIPAEAQSRVSAFDHFVSVTFMPLGYLVMGPLAAGLGVRATSVAATVVTALVSAAVALTPALRRLTAVPGGG